jgi:hypothetical protein
MSVRAPPSRLTQPTIRQNPRSVAPEHMTGSGGEHERGCPVANYFVPSLKLPEALAPVPALADVLFVTLTFGAATFTFGASTLASAFTAGG